MGTWKGADRGKQCCRPGIYGRNQSGCEQAKNVGFLLFTLWVFLTIYIFVAMMKITICF